MAFLSRKKRQLKKWLDCLVVCSLSMSLTRILAQRIKIPIPIIYSAEAKEKNKNQSE